MKKTPLQRLQEGAARQARLGAQNGLAGATLRGPRAKNVLGASGFQAAQPAQTLAGRPAGGIGVPKKGSKR